ncbi:MAG: hypothetical protein KAJ51_01245, partial [Thermoplasmata archaeon]|nr:hypothetical protein [Thermoplasmata archaeon]
MGEYTSIALDASDRPHISYYNYTNDEDNLKYAYWNGSAWNISTVDSTGNVGEYTSIALDANDHPHISYFDYTNEDLKYAHWNGSAWNISTIDSAGMVGLYTSIALDASDHPHISYYALANDDLKYAYWNGSAWNISTVDSASYVGYYTSIALDTSDHPHISYQDESINYDLKYAHWNGSVWNKQTIDSEGVVGMHTSIALDTNDYPHIGYYDYTNEDLKYAHIIGYYSTGTLISQQYNTESPIWKTLSWNASVPANTNIKFQLRSSLSIPSFVGPDGTNSTYYTSSPSNIWSGLSTDIPGIYWIQYKAYLSTTNSSLTPILEDITIYYNCIPTTPNLITPINNSLINDNTPIFSWIFNDLDSTQSGFQVLIDDDIGFGSVDNNSGEQSTSNQYWQFPENTSYTTIPDGTWHWKVRTNDSDGDWGPYSSPWTLTIDTQPPYSLSISINNGDEYTSSTSVTLSLSAQDTVGLDQMAFSNDNVSWDTWEPYSTS